MDRLINVRVGSGHLWKDSNLAGNQGEANSKKLRIEFDEGWDGYAKKVTFWDAKGQNPVERTLTADMLEDMEDSTRVYLCPIPGEPMAEAGMLTFVIEGYLDGVRQRTVAAELEVQRAPIANNAGEPADPTPTQAEQLQVQIDAMLGDMQEQAVRAETAASGAEAAKTAAEQARADAEASAEAAEDSKYSAADSAREASESADRAAQTLGQVSADVEAAAESARAAEESAQVAKASVDTVTAAQEAAAQSASDAQQSAAAAADAASGIQDSVDAAAESAAQAKASAQGVSAYADEARASASAAKTSETNAASSASKAKTSETNAAASVASVASAKNAAESAATRAETAKTAAESAKTAAQTAKTAAESAKAAAETAKAGAESANAAALEAKSDAEAAQGGAESARDRALVAQSGAEDALLAAQQAQASAEKAAEEAQEAAGGDFATPGFVTEQIAIHNEDEDAHADIREMVSKAGKLPIVDNEWGTDYSPAWYMENKPEQVAAERRSPTTIGLEGRTYCTVMTYTHGNSSAYGYPVQVAFVDGVVYVRKANGSSGWRAWEVLATQSDVESYVDEKIPTATAEDNGKFLRVVNGVWAAETLTNVAEEGA